MTKGTWFKNKHKNEFYRFHSKRQDGLLVFDACKGDIEMTTKFLIGYPSMIDDIEQVAI